MNRLTIGRRIQVAFTLAFLLFVGWEYLGRGPAATTQLAILQVEARRIRPEPGAKHEAPTALSKPDLASLGLRYHSQSSCSKVFSYYDAELNRNGWSFVREYRTGYETYRRYAKQRYVADVDCGGHLDDSYSVSFDWSGPTDGALGPALFMALLLVIFALWAPAVAVCAKVIEARKRAT